MANTIRIARISSINYEEGKARVVYDEMDESVSSELPYLAWWYHMIDVGDQVVVACFSSGTVSGVILGPIWNADRIPAKGEAGIHREELSNNVDEAVIEYSEKDQKLTIHAPEIELISDKKSILVKSSNAEVKVQGSTESGTWR